jgi:hypothetical protein
MTYNTDGAIFPESSNFLMQYSAAWDKSYDRPIKTVEKDNKKYLQYELIGLNGNHITVKKNFINKTKTLFVTVTGKYTNEVTGFENEINIKLDVDYNIYDKVTYEIADGILTLILHETINDEPNFKLEEKKPWENFV